MHVGLYAAQDNGFAAKLQATSWDLTVPIVVWIASWYDTIPSRTTIQNDYCPMPSIAGYFPMIWQYYGSQHYDYDISPYEGFKSNGHWEATLAPGICG